MSTTTKTRTRRKPERRIRLLKPIQHGIGAMQIVIDGEPHNYLIFPLKSDFGAAFRLVKKELLPIDPGVWELHDTARYDVNLNGLQSTCECKGFLQRGKCKHVDGLTTLRQRNLI
jgi:hypothetical protein